MLLYVFALDLLNLLQKLSSEKGYDFHKQPSCDAAPLPDLLLLCEVSLTDQHG